MTVPRAGAAVGVRSTFPRAAALGDSVTSGDGVGVITPKAQTWAALVAGRVGVSSFVNLARAGARLDEVRAVQLPAALAHRPQLATLCVGLNDVAKTGCPPAGVRDDVLALVGGLRAAGAVVVVTRLHDPGRIFRLPRGLATQVRGRVAILNDAVDEVAAGDPGVVVVELGALAEEPACWAVDRVHPSGYGQRRLSALALAELGYPADACGVAPPAPTAAAHGRWLVRHGLPYLARRCGELGPPFAGMALTAARTRAAAVGRRAG